MIQIFNTLSGRKEELRTLEPGVVRMYVCGDTVYDYCHIGHARSKIAFDVVRRYLAYRGYKVTFVRNITDIDDKIIKRAAENGESVQALTARFTAATLQMSRAGLEETNDSGRTARSKASARSRSGARAVASADERSWARTNDARSFGGTRRSAYRRCASSVRPASAPATRRSTRRRCRTSS